MAFKMLPSHRGTTTLPTTVSTPRSTPLRPRRLPIGATSITTQPTTLSDAQAHEWTSCRDILVSKGWSAEDADTILCKAFGWSGQVYWRGSKEEASPDQQEVLGTLDFLESIGVTGDNLCKLVNTFPEVLGCGVDTIVRPNVEVLQKQWKIKGNTLVKTLLRRPDVLGYNLDCEGSCVGECERCWARF